MYMQQQTTNNNTSRKTLIHLSLWYRFHYEPVPKASFAPVRGLRGARRFGTGWGGAFVPVRVRNRYERPSAKIQARGGARGGPLVPVRNTNRYQRVPPILLHRAPIPALIYLTL